MSEKGEALTIWWCERCHASGADDIDGLGVYDAVYQLESAHDGHRLASLQGCTFAVGQVRVKFTDALAETRQAKEQA